MEAVIAHARPLRIYVFAALLAVLFALQAAIAARAAAGMFEIGRGIDWEVLTEGGRRIAAGLDPYQTDVLGIEFRWHPVTAWLFYLLAPFGIWTWRLVNLASLALLRDWRLIALAMLSWPLWDALFSGNATILVVTVGFAALTGSRSGSLGYLVLCAVIPRPWMAPLALWLLWKRPELRPWAVGIAVASVASAFALGWGLEWAHQLVASAGEMANGMNWGPTRLLGVWWYVVGLPLAGLAFWRGRLGIAGLAISPYLFVHYYLALLWELTPRSVRRTGGHRPRQPPSS